MQSVYAAKDLGLKDTKFSREIAHRLQTRTLTRTKPCHMIKNKSVTKTERDKFPTLGQNIRLILNTTDEHTKILLMLRTKGKERTSWCMFVRVSAKDGAKEEA